MGLDMYLNRYPRYKDYTPDEIQAYDNWSRYYKEKNPSYAFWCAGKGLRVPSDKDIKALESFRHTSYSPWDEEHKCPHEEISEDVAYWRKANAIHQWFVDNVQGGHDDCGMYEVKKYQLETLKNKCQLILENCVLVKGRVRNGARCTEKGWEDIWQDGLTVINPEVCEEELPTQSGFFFGQTDYDQWYIQSIRYTYETICKILKETNFKKQTICYCSSW